MFIFALFANLLFTIIWTVIGAVIAGILWVFGGVKNTHDFLIVEYIAIGIGWLYAFFCDLFSKDYKIKENLFSIILAYLFYLIFLIFLVIRIETVWF